MDRPIFDYITGGLASVYGICHFCIIILILTCKRIREKKSNQLLLNLSTGHALCGFTSLTGCFLPFSHQSMDGIIFASYIYSNTSLAMLTIDRCIYIKWPFRYNSLPTLLHVSFMACSPLNAGFVIYKALDNDNNLHVSEDVESMRVFIFGIGALMALLLSANSLVFCTLQGQKRKIKSLRVATFSQSNVRTNFNQRKREIQAFYICLGCTLTYVVLWFPPLIVTIINFYTKIQISYYYFSMSMVSVNLNPLSDALIFVWFNKDLKNRLFQLRFLRRFAPEIDIHALSKTGGVSNVQSTTM